MFELAFSISGNIFKIFLYFFEQFIFIDFLMLLLIIIKYKYAKLFLISQMHEILIQCSF